MFKARLISDPEYYIIWKRVYITGFVVYISLGIFFVLRSFFIPFDNEWISMILIVLMGLLSNLPLIFYYKRINALSTRYWLELDQDTIKVTDNKGVVDQLMEIGTEDRILANANYDLEDPPWKFITKKYRKNKITIMNEKAKATFYFRPDSFYSLSQLETILRSWQEKGCRLERIKM